MAVHTFFMIGRAYKERPGSSLCRVVVVGASDLIWENETYRKEGSKTFVILMQEEVYTGAYIYVFY